MTSVDYTTSGTLFISLYQRQRENIDNDYFKVVVRKLKLSPVTDDYSIH